MKSAPVPVSMPTAARKRVPQRHRYGAARQRDDDHRDSDRADDQRHSGESVKRRRGRATWAGGGERSVGQRGGHSVTGFRHDRELARHEREHDAAEQRGGDANGHLTGPRDEASTTSHSRMTAAPTGRHSAKSQTEASAGHAAHEVRHREADERDGTRDRGSEPGEQRHRHHHERS